MARLLQHRSGEGPPLVLLHGLGGDWRTWAPILPALERHHEVLALDLPGHGAVAPLTRRPTVAAVTDAVEAELDALGIEHPHVAGNSVGGRFALELAIRGRAATVVALSPSGLEAPPERALVFAADQLLRVRAKTAVRWRERLAAHAVGRTLVLGGPHARPWRLAAGEAAHEIERIAGARAFQSTLLWSGMADVPRGLRRIRCPTRLAFGVADLLLGALTAPRYAALIPGAELVALPGCGHVPMGDDPALVARTVLDVTAAPASA
jgi:pimeloyl-ACP methyl ester carboxylesterase